MLAEVLIGVLGNAIYGSSTLAIKKLFDQTPAQQAISKTADEFPSISVVKDALKKWTQSDTFAESLEQLRTSSNKQQVEEKLINSFIEEGLFHDGLINTYESAQRVLDAFAGNLEIALFRSPDGLWHEDQRAHARHKETQSGLQEIKDILQEPRSENASQIWGVPYPQNRFFTGREIEICQIRKALVEGGASALTQPQAISGLGGIGKTQTAVEYAYQWHEKYKAVLWVKADSRESLISGFVAIARLLSLPEVNLDDQPLIVEAVLHWLVNTPDWLLIFDNADDVDLVENFIPTKPQGHILLTSRAREFDKLSIISSIRLEKLSPDEAEKLLRKRVGRKELQVEEDQAIERLARELDYLPLALEQAGAYISKTMCSFESYLKCYVEHGLTLLDKSEPKVGKYDKSVATTWLLNFEQVEQILQASADLLRACAFLDPDEIPIEIFIDGAKEFGPSISAQLSEIDLYPTAFDELIQPIADFSLIRRDLSARTFSIHRLVQAVLRLQLNEEDQVLWVERIIQAIIKTIPSPNFSMRQGFSRFFPQVLKCAEYIEKFNITSQEAQRILLLIGKHFMQQNQLAESEQYILRAIAISENTKEARQDEMMTRSLVNLGSIYFIRGKYTEAESVLLRALGIYEKMQQVEHVGFSACLNALGELYRTLGRYADAKKYYEQAAPFFEFMLTIGHPSTTLVGVNGLRSCLKIHNGLSLRSIKRVMAM